MKTKIKKVTVASLLGIFAVAIFAAVAWSTVASNAFATDDQNTTQDLTNQEIAVDENQNAENPCVDLPVNETCKVSFNIKGVDSGTSTTYAILIDSVPDYNYKLGDKLDFERGAKVKFREESRLAVSDISLSVDQGGVKHTLTFQVHTPIGYALEAFEPADITALDENTDFNVKYKKSDIPYNLKVNVFSDSPRQALPNIEVKLNKADWSDYKTATTDSSGICTFIDLSADDALGILTIENDDYCDYINPLRDQTYDKDHNGSCNAVLYSKEGADFILNNPGEYHKYFELSLKVTLGSGQVFIDFSGRKTSFVYKMPIDITGTWQVELDGALKLDKNVTGGNIQVYAKPLCDDGYITNKWKRITENNDVEYIELGETFNVDEDVVFNFEPVYTEAPQPGPTPPDPDPTPTPASEEVVASAQTGDSTAAIPLAILAATCTVALIAIRKRA